jgi:hypothetical protein
VTLPTAKEVYLESSVAIADGSTVALTAITLPAGSYLLEARTRLATGAGGSGTWSCALNGDPTADSTSDDTDSGTFTTQANTTTATTGVTVTLGSGSAIALRCHVGGKPATASETRIIATPLAAANRVAGTQGAGGS